MSEAMDALMNMDEPSSYTVDPSTEEHITISDTRVVTVPEALKRIAVQYDHNIETVTFDCPRYWDGHDLSQMNIYINFKTPSGKFGSYIVDNIVVEDNIMHFDWTITREVTLDKGNIIFLVCAKTADAEGNEVLHWNSELCASMFVVEGLEVEPALVEDYPVIMTQLLDRMNILEQKAEANLTAVLYIEQNLDDSQKTQARNNIGAVSAYEMELEKQLFDMRLRAAVSTNAQSLDEGKKAQARQNISALSVDEANELVDAKLEEFANGLEGLDKIALQLDEVAPAETVPSICDFTLTPTTPEAAYALYFSPFLPNGQFFKTEVPVLTTKGTLSVKDAEGNTKYSRYIEPIFNARGVADVLTHKGLEKKWSEKFYLTKAPSVTAVPPPWAGAPENFLFVWEFDESEFINTGIPAKIHDIPMASPCFINNDSSETKLNTLVLWNGDAYPAFFSYSEETGKYTLTAKGIAGSTITYQLTHYSKVHFYYALETPYNLPFNFAMGIDAGDQISFEADLVDNQPYIDALGGFRNKSVDPSIVAFVPRNVEDALHGMDNAARILNADDSVSGDATVQGYSWIGEGDGVTDYTVQIQSKLDELHSASNGGTIHLGPGTYPISKSLIIYSNTQIIGDGHTIIEQRADNTHAVIWSGSNIRMCDLTIKLAGECTEETACIYTNDANTTVFGGEIDERFPENIYVQSCSTSNVKLSGTYQFSYENGYAYLSERDLNYRGVGVLSRSSYFNFCDGDGITCTHLYAGIASNSGGNQYRVQIVDCRFGVYRGGGNNIYNITGHTYYGEGSDGIVSGTEYIVYGTTCCNNDFTIGFYDTQHTKALIYFSSAAMFNRYNVMPVSTGLVNSKGTTNFKRYEIIDHGRNNTNVQPVKEEFVGIGSRLVTTSGLPYWNTQFNPSIHNALSGAGVWGIITSNMEWTSYGGIKLSDVCRYPKETGELTDYVTSVVCNASPSEGSPVEIIIDVSNRPITSYKGIWIQFDHRYVAEEYTVSVDTQNDGVYDSQFVNVVGNINPINYNLGFQYQSVKIYRIKISITKALQIPELTYQNADHTMHTMNYNPDGLVGIVNIGIPSNEAYGRAFLGECGGNLYGDVDMNGNTLKNLPDPVDDGDAVNKAYLEDYADSMGGLPEIAQDSTEEVIMAERNPSFSLGTGGYYIHNLSSAITIVGGEEYRVIWDGVEYRCTAESNVVTSSITEIYLGNRSIIYSDEVDTKEPFCLHITKATSKTTYTFCTNSTAYNHKVKIIQGEPGSDEGKFLRVVNGVWGKVALSSAEEANF